MRSFDGVRTRQEELDHLVVVLVRRQYQRRDVRRVLVLLLHSEERVLLTDRLRTLDADEVARMVGDDANDVHETLADGVQERLLDALPRDLVQEEFDALDRLRVDGEVERVATHVVDAVDVDADVVRFDQLLDEVVVAETTRVEEQPLFGVQLHRNRNGSPSISAAVGHTRTRSSDEVWDLCRHTGRVRSGQVGSGRVGSGQIRIYYLCNNPGHGTDVIHRQYKLVWLIVDIGLVVTHLKRT